ncbi:hypothetical protein OG21DRAFT_1372720, partial [Imleria badia]
PPMPCPSAGSASPSASLAALWGYILPALNHIFRSPTNSIDKAPTIDISYHIGIHTAIYDYFAAQSAASVNVRVSMHAIDPATNGQLTGRDLYKCLDKYYMDLAQELLLRAPEDDTTLIRYIIPCFKRYSVGACAVNRLLNYVNRYYVERAIGEAPLEALALKRFRTEFIGPLMAAPKVNGKTFRPGVASIGDKSHLPKNRLVCAVQEVLDAQDVKPEQRRNLAKDLAATLCAVGVYNRHPLQKKLKGYF